MYEAIFALRIRPALNFLAPRLYLNLTMMQWLGGECPSSEGEEDVVLARTELEAPDAPEK